MKVDCKAVHVAMMRKLLADRDADHIEARTLFQAWFEIDEGPLSSWKAVFSRPHTPYIKELIALGVAAKLTGTSNG